MEEITTQLGLLAEYNSLAITVAKRKKIGIDTYSSEAEKTFQMEYRMLEISDQLSKIAEEEHNKRWAAALSRR